MLFKLARSYSIRELKIIMNPLLTNILSKTLCVVLSKQLHHHLHSCLDGATISSCHQQMAACGSSVVISDQQIYSVYQYTSTASVV
jgi:hypothetical protein